MLKAKDFRYYAREALKGRWLKAGGVAFVAGLLGASISVNNVSWNFNMGSTETETNAVDVSGISSEVSGILMAVILSIILIALIWLIVMLVVGGATTLGYAKYNLNLVDDKNPRLPDILSQFDRLGTGFGMQFFRILFVFLWSLLLVIPGIIAGYRYYMTPYILCENPDMTAREAIRESKKLMKGNKWRLFCLELSFIGWILLGVLIMFLMMMFVASGIAFAGTSSLYGVSAGVVIIFILMIMILAVVASVFLTPYMTAATAVFYREISEGRYSNPHVEVDGEDIIYENIVIEE